MGKNSNTSSKSTSKSNISKTSNTITRSNNRPNPLIPKAGITHSGRRTYGNGGKVNY